MNSLFIRIGVGTIALTALFLTLTCGTSPGSGNQDQSQSPTQNAELDAMIAALRAQCQSATNTNEKANAVNAAITNHLVRPKYEPLRRQIADETLQYSFNTYPTNQIEIVISGKFRGTMLDAINPNRPGEETTMEGFLDILDNFTKKGCIDRVRFLPDARTAAPDSEAFEWVGCDAGTVYCSNGQCAPPPCARLTNTSTSTPANAGPNSN